MANEKLPAETDSYGYESDSDLDEDEDLDHSVVVEPKTTKNETEKGAEASLQRMHASI